MLEIQKAKAYLRSVMRSKGASAEEIAKAEETPPFKPAFIDGKRRRDARGTSDESYEVPTSEFAFRKED